MYWQKKQVDTPSEYLRSSWGYLSSQCQFLTRTDVSIFTENVYAQQHASSVVWQELR